MRIAADIVAPMAARPQHRRAQDFKPGRVSGWPADAGEAAIVASRASYVPDGKHKDYPAPGGEWTYFRNSEGSKCPPIARDRWHELHTALRAAIRAGVVGGEFRGDFPARVWIYIGARLCEARLSNQETGQYHGFPLDYEEHHPSDPHALLELAPRITL